MKKLDFVLILIISVLVHIIVSANTLINDQELDISILKDQVGDYAQQISVLRSQKTYDQGLEDGFKNSTNLQYVKGYHAALKDNNGFSQELEVVEK